MTSSLDAIKGKFIQLKEPTRDAAADTVPVEKIVKDVIANVRQRSLSRSGKLIKGHQSYAGGN